MKILIDSNTPALLAHGGAQTQVEQTKSSLEKLGVEVEYLRWWDKQQKGDLIQYFGTANNFYLSLAKTASMPVVMTTLFTETCNRSDPHLKLQGFIVQSALKFPVARRLKEQLNWLSFKNAAHNVVGLECEKKVLQEVYRIPDKNISIVPYGLSEIFLRAGKGRRDEAHLICTGTITQRKNSVELARLAHAAQTPILFVGKPYHPDDPYWLRFKKLIDERWVKYVPHVEGENEMVSLLQSSRAFVLMSQFENWCLSAHEAAACGLPLLVPDQKWSRERFGDQARYFASIGFNSKNVQILKKFYADAADLPAPAIKLFSWREVAQDLQNIYKKILQ